jgi:uncharacterized SAM-binding protein YcdF (DUF218 family)
MSVPRPARPRRGFVRLVGVACLVALAAVAGFLPFAGRFLVREDPLARADVILVLAGARVERWLEGVDLYKEKWAPHVLLSPGPMDPIELDLRARGVRIPLEGELARDGMLQMGVPAEAISILPGGMDNTAHEASTVRGALEARGWRRLIVVTSKYHTRRTGFTFRREFAGTPVEIIVRSSRYDRASPARWWTRRADIRYVVSELPKLIAYYLGVGE